MFSSFRRSRSRSPDSLCPPTTEEIQEDLLDAPIDDVVFMTRVPQIGDGEPFKLEERFKQLHSKEKQIKSKKASENQTSDRDNDNVMDKLIAHRLNLEHLKSLRSKLSNGLDELREKKPTLVQDLNELQSLQETTSDLYEKVKSADVVKH